MWCVAVDTVILHRFMFVNKRAALLGMTQITGFVNRSPDQGHWSVGTMRVVAIGASDRTFPDRMPIGLIDLHFFLQMTGKTYVRLAVTVEHRVPLCMHAVAGYTTQILGGMCAVSPIDVIPLVARQADTTLLFSTRFGLPTKPHG